jgi:hypothetical protein
MAFEHIGLATLAALAGRWNFGQEAALYLGPEENAFAPFGVAIAGPALRSGIVKTTVVFPDQPSVGRVVFGHNAATGEYFSAGIGGYGYAYLLDMYIPNTGWRGLRTEGSANNLRAGVPYQVEVHVRGQRVALFVDSIRVLEGNLPHPMTDDRIGLFAWGEVPVRFAGLQADIGRPQAFVVMQYTSPFDVLFTDVIEPVAREAGFIAYRAADVYRPGLVLQDIIQGLTESEVIVAEITPTNQNVFYELGYAHALEKPTILLAERSQRGELPFDIRGYRVIFYDNTIGGKKEVTENLRKHLATIKGAWETPPQAG